MWGAKKGYHVIAWAKDYTNLPQNALIVTDKKIASARDQVKRTIKGTIEAPGHDGGAALKVDWNAKRATKEKAGDAKPK